MYKLKYADYDGNYKGFSLKKGYFYGEDTETGIPIAASGREMADGKIAIHFLVNGVWTRRWLDIASDFSIENLPNISTNEKISFAYSLKDMVKMESSLKKPYRQRCFPHNFLRK